MVAGSLLLVGVFSVVSAAPLPADVVPFKERNFKIPIKIDPSRRADIKELILYSSTDEGRTWGQVAVATPEKDGFPFYAQSEGVYWFSVVIVDQKGDRQPTDIYKAPPGLKTLVDTLRPNIRLVTAERQGEEVVVSWDVQEDYPELNTLKLEYRAADAPNWATSTTVPISPTPSGQTRFRVYGNGPISIRMQIKDKAENEGTAQAEVPAASAIQQTNRVTPTPPLPAPGPVERPSAFLDPNPPVALPPAAQPVQPASREWALPRTEQSSQTISQPMERDPRIVAHSNAEPVVTPAYTPTGAPPRGPLPPLQLVNHTQLALEYEVTKTGPSGLGSVELYMTQDEGRTWKRYADDPDHKSPILANLPGEGVYGFRLVVLSGAGLGKGAPMVGDAPEIRVEVDTTPPVAQLYRPEPDPQRRDTLVISWNASDKNLAPNPIALQWAERADATWTNIAADLPNGDHYNWQLPPGLPARVYLRLMVRDQAGNVSTAETREAILVDLNKPEVRLTGISAITAVRRP